MIKVFLNTVWVFIWLLKWKYFSVFKSISRWSENLIEAEICSVYLKYPKALSCSASLSAISLGKKSCFVPLILGVFLSIFLRLFFNNHQLNLPTYLFSFLLIRFCRFDVFISVEFTWLFELNTVENYPLIGSNISADMCG